MTSFNSYASDTETMLFNTRTLFSVLEPSDERARDVACRSTMEHDE